MKLLRLRSTNLLIRNVYSNSHKILHENINYESFSKDYQENHVKTSFFQKKILALGSSVISLCDPQRGDMIAVLGEVTGGSSLRALNDQMANDQEGAQILQLSIAIELINQVLFEKSNLFPFFQRDA